MLEPFGKLVTGKTTATSKVVSAIQGASLFSTKRRKQSCDFRPFHGGSFRFSKTVHMVMSSSGCGACEACAGSKPLVAHDAASCGVEGLLSGLRRLER